MTDTSPASLMKHARPRAALVGLVAALPAAALVYLVLDWIGADVSSQGRITAAIATLLAVLWISEGLPLPVTSLLPLVLFPLTGVLSFKQAAAPYADSAIYVYLGGFLLALSIERWNLHRRLALGMLLAVGTQPARLVGGIMLATAALSMWISNTATTAMMLPLGLSLVALLNEQAKEHRTVDVSLNTAEHFATCMMLGIAYAATLGGLGTLIGTPTNAYLAGFAQERGLEISFARWLVFATPLSAVFLLLTWWWLTQALFRLPKVEVPQSDALIRRELASLGPLSRGEAIVLIVFLLTASLWLAREPLMKWEWLVGHWPGIKNLNDGMIALAGACLLFAIPVYPGRGIYAMDWQATQRLPWGVLLLFGGGLSLAEAIASSQLADWIGLQVAAWGSFSTLALVLAVTASVIFASELTSNVATVAAFLPILFGVSQGLGSDPRLLLVAAALSASCAFMLPVGTPPNAIVFGSGHIQQSQMMRAGIWLNLIGIVLIPLAVYTLGVWVLGIRVGRG